MLTGLGSTQVFARWGGREVKYSISACEPPKRPDHVLQRVSKRMHQTMQKQTPRSSASEIRARSPRPTNRALGLDERLEHVESGRSAIPTRKSKRAAKERVGIAYRAHGHRKLRRCHLGGESAARRGVLPHAAIGQWERLTDGHSDQGCGTGFRWRVRFRIDGSSCSSRFASIQSGTTLSALRVGRAPHPWQCSG